MQFYNFLKFFHNYYCVIFFLLILCTCSTKAEKVLVSPLITNWGNWGPWEFCPSGMFATGMQLQTQPPQGFFKDDRGLTGIRLFCNKYGKNDGSHPIKSSTDNVGNWGRKYNCNGFMTGFQLRSEKARSFFVDDTAANNLRMFCDHNGNLFQQGGGTSNGKWTDKQLCGRYEAVCGIRTQVEKAYSADKTGLNNVMMKCCDIPHPIQKCVPITTWQVITTCNAINSTADKQCSYSRKVGIAYLDTFSDSVQMHERVGYGLKRMITQFQSNFFKVYSDVSFEAMVREDSKEQYWLLSPSYVWEPQSIVKGKVTAKPGLKVDVYQINGKCGMLQVWGTRIKKVEKDPKVNANVTIFSDFTNENELDYLL